MDAKPQRPGRLLPSHATSTFADENAAVSKQSLHQRHKSIGNIKSAMASNSISHGLNAAAKRTVFGDVSNTAHALVEVAPKDKELAKPRLYAVSRADKKQTTATTMTTDKESAWHGGAFLRPAQRASGPLPLATTSMAPKPPAHLEMPVAKPAATKKATFVFSDEQNSNIPKLPSAASFAPISQLPAVDKRVKNPRHFKSQPQLRTTSSMNTAIPRTMDKHSNSAGELISVEPQPEMYQAKPRPANSALPPTQRRDLEVNNSIAQTDDGASDAHYEDALENLASLSSSIETELCTQQDQEPYRETGYSRQVASEYTHHQTDLIRVPSRGPGDEENWDGDEDDGDFYEEHGYTTAHSYRSHGDNTTGGVTTIIAPKLTTKVRKELEAARIHVEQHTTPDQVEEECWDTSMVAEYGEEIFEYMRIMEAKPALTPNPHYMDIQSDIMWSMRSILMDWLVQVHARFNLLPETLFLTVNCIDRFLSVKVVSLSKLQLVGATAIFVAAKYEEINCPSVQEIVYMVDGGFTIEEVLKAERFMLSMLDFELGWPGPMSFLRRISKADDYCIETRTLAKYFLEVTIMDERFVGSPPSFLAAGAHCLARLMLKKGDWSLAHTHWSGYTIGQLKPLVGLIFECCLDARKHHWAVYDKFKASRYRNASVFVESEMAKGYILDFHPFDMYTSSPPSTTPLDDFPLSMVQYAMDEPRRLVPAQG